MPAFCAQAESARGGRRCFALPCRGIRSGRARCRDTGRPRSRPAGAGGSATRPRAKLTVRPVFRRRHRVGDGSGRRTEDVAPDGRRYVRHLHPRASPLQRHVQLRASPSLHADANRLARSASVIFGQASPTRSCLADAAMAEMPLGSMPFPSTRYQQILNLVPGSPPGNDRRRKDRLMPQSAGRDKANGGA